MSRSESLSYYDNAYTRASEIVVDLRAFVEYVRSPALERAISVLRGLDPEQYREKKKNLPGVTVYGEFLKKAPVIGRKDQHLSHYAGLSHLDLDNLEPNQVLSYPKRLSTDPHVLLAFVSPSGRGLKIFCRHEHGLDRHEDAYYAFKEHIRALLNCPESHFDDSVRSISKLCFASHDPDAYYNPNASPFVIPEKQAPDGLLFDAATYRIQDTDDEHGMLPDMQRTAEQLQYIGGYEQYNTKDGWIRVGLAIKAEHGDAGFPLWRDWSAQASNASSEAEMLKKWAGFDPTRISGATLTYLAKEAGWRPRKDTGDWDEKPRNTGAKPQDTGAGEDSSSGPESEPEPETSTKPNPLLSFDEFLADMSAPEFLVGDTLEADTLVTLIGAPGVGKSFLALDWALSIATGTEWQGKPVQQGNVYYFAGEGKAGMKRRMSVWRDTHGGQSPGSRFRIMTGGWDLTELDSVKKLYALMLEVVQQDGPPALIVVDTLARHFGANNENDTQSMNGFITYMDRLRGKFSETKCSILVVHHVGKDLERGARGSSALHGAVDASYLLEKGDAEKSPITLKCLKMKDAEAPAHCRFELKSVPVRRPDGHQLVKEDGAPVTSAVLVPVDAEDEGVEIPSRRIDYELKAYQAFLELWEKGENNLLESGRDLTDLTVDPADWSALCRSPKYGLSKFNVSDVRLNKRGRFGFFHARVRVENRHMTLVNPQAKKAGEHGPSG